MADHGGDFDPATKREIDAFLADRLTDGETPDDYRFYTVRQSGVRHPPEFPEVGGGLALLVRRSRWDRVPGG